MDYNEIEQKKRKALRWVELAVYVVVVVAVGLKVLPIFWRILTANI
jgi:flagellar basal body-associated protein FliL